MSRNKGGFRTRSPRIGLRKVGAVSLELTSAILNTRRDHFQCSGDLAEPGDAGVFEGGVGVEAFGDGVADDGLPFFFEQGDELLLLLDQLINLRRLVVEEFGDLDLFGEGWERTILRRVRDNILHQYFDLPSSMMIALNSPVNSA